jgi:hypothetical protein
MKLRERAVGGGAKFCGDTAHSDAILNPQNQKILNGTKNFEIFLFPKSK